MGNDTRAPVSIQKSIGDGTSPSSGKCFEALQPPKRLIVGDDGEAVILEVTAHVPDNADNGETFQFGGTVVFFGRVESAADVGDDLPSS